MINELSLIRTREGRVGGGCHPHLPFELLVNVKIGRIMAAIVDDVMDFSSVKTHIFLPYPLQHVTGYILDVKFLKYYNTTKIKGRGCNYPLPSCTTVGL